MKNGIVYTPDNIVDFMLEGIIEDVEKLSILDPCCGEGAFAKKLLSAKSLLAYDIDKDALKVATEIGINAINQDYLKSSDNEKYDLIIGNPPYIKVHDLSKEVRNFIKTNFLTCKNGTIDIFFAFIEKSLRKLNKGGVLRFIIPNSWLKNSSASELRKILLAYDVEVYDFGSEKVFNGFDIYCCIITVKNSNYDDFVTIIKDDNKLSIKKSNLTNGEKWISSINNKFDFNLDLKNGVATLCDKAYIFKKNENEFYYSDLIKKWVFIEKEMIRPITKASTGDKFVCLYPYDKNGVAMEEQYIKDNYPKAYSYFMIIKERLLKRTYDSEWYLYGRSQGVKNMYGRKLIISPLVSSEGFKYYVENDPKVIVYSGLFQILDNNETEKQLIDFFENKEVKEYILLNGRNMSSGWVSFSKSLISTIIKKGKNEQDRIRK